MGRERVGKQGRELHRVRGKTNEKEGRWRGRMNKKNQGRENMTEKKSVRGKYEKGEERKSRRGQKDEE